MKFNIKNYIMESFKELLMNGRLILGIIIALFPAVVMAGFILKHPENAMFEIKHVSNFYCAFGLLAAVLTTLFFVDRDFGSNTISLINSSKRNRIAYAASNFIVSFVIAAIYAAIGIGTCVIASRMGVPGKLGIKFLNGFCINLILLIPSYFLFCYILVLFRMKKGMIYTLLSVALLFAPSIISNILPLIRNDVISKVIENCPLYFYPIYAGSNVMSSTQYIVGIVCLILAIIIVIKKSIRYQ